MSKVLRHVKHQSIQRSQRDREMASKGLRFRSQIDDNVMNSALAASDQFCLLMGCSLEMHAPQSTFPLVEGNTALYQLRVQSVPLELSATPSAGKKSATVLLGFGFDDKGPLQIRFSEDHEKILTSGIGTTKRPPQWRM